MSVLDRAAELQARGERFAIATVVRTVSVTAAKAGAKAIIGADGAIAEGWIGGGCARAAVIQAAKQCLDDGRSRLISIAPKEGLDELGVAPGEDRDGVLSPATPARARARWTFSSSRCCRYRVF